VVKKKYFTLENAIKILPEVKTLLKELIQTHAEIHMQDKISLIYEDPYLDAYEEIKNGLFFHKRSYKFLKNIKKLMKLGVFVKDPRIGLVDFYSKHKGREIFFCYRYPEKTIEYWHSAEEGYQGRKHVSLLKEEIQK